jgi:selenoprotein W-related protein
LTLIPSDGGRFELTVNGKLLFSKLRLGRHADPGEISGLLQKYLNENP